MDIRRFLIVGAVVLVVAGLPLSSFLSLGLGRGCRAILPSTGKFLVLLPRWRPVL